MNSYATTRRRWLRAGVAGALAAAFRHGFAVDATPPVQGIRRLSGFVSVNGKPASPGQRILPGDEIVTGPASDAVFVVGQDAFLQREASTVRFGAAPAVSFMRVVSGKILSVFGPGDKRIDVSTAVIGIRGTGCYIEESVGRTYFCLCYGEAEIVPTAAPGARETIRTQHHDHPVYINGDPGMPTSMVPADVLNHADAELVFLEGLLGRKPPFAGSHY